MKMSGQEAFEALSRIERIWRGRESEGRAMSVESAFAILRNVKGACPAGSRMHRRASLMIDAIVNNNMEPQAAQK
jgi:hypothetical protein